MTYRQRGAHSTHGYQPEGFLRRMFPEPVAVKVPEITALFWVVKILTTAGGEATSDWLSLGNRIVGGGIEAGIFLIALFWQFRTKRYTAAAYWLLAYAIAIFGTGIADAMHLFIGIPYAGTSLLWGIVLAIIFWLWYRSEGTLSIHSIRTTRRECYYWATVFATFALGTAVGDYTATALHLGYLASGVAFGIAILIPLMLWSGLNVNSVFCFWFAYVLTRPLGASFADYFSKPHHLSGADYGDGPVALVTTILVAIFVAYLAISRSDIQRPEEVVPGGGPGYPGHAANYPEPARGYPEPARRYPEPARRYPGYQDRDDDPYEAYYRQPADPYEDRLR